METSPLSLLIRMERLPATDVPTVNTWENFRYNLHIFTSLFVAEVTLREGSTWNNNNKIQVSVVSPHG